MRDTIVIVEWADDWEVVYVNGKKEDENHTIERYALLDFIFAHNNPIVQFYESSVDIDEQPDAPDLLSEIDSDKLTLRRSYNVV
jgi:hypothetical protein